MLSICNVNGHRNPRDVTDKSSCRRQNLDQNQEENNRNNHMDCATCFMDSTSNLHTVLMENIKAQGDLRIFFFFLQTARLVSIRTRVPSLVSLTRGQVLS